MTTYDQVGGLLYDYQGMLYDGSNQTPTSPSRSSATYRIVIKSATNYSTFDLTPGAVEAIIHKATNIGYTEIVGNIPVMFFTLSQDDLQAVQGSAKTLKKIFAYSTENAYPYHFLVYRNNELVWGGLGPMEIDETSKDLIVYCYGYLAAAYWTLTGWKDEWTSQTVRTIYKDAWDAGAAKTNSMIDWITKGNLETPVTTSGGATQITLPYYQANYKRILFLLREMAAYSASDTNNRVWFEITPDGVFNFWKNKGYAPTTIRFAYPNGNVMDFSRYRMPVDSRTKLYGVGTSPTAVALQDAQENTSLSGTLGLREDSIYMQWVRDSDELSRVTKHRLKIANKIDRQIALTLAPNTIAPIRATGGLVMMNDYLISINKGSVVMNENRLLVGNQVIFTGGREYVRPIFQDVPVA